MARFLLSSADMRFGEGKRKFFSVLATALLAGDLYGSAPRKSESVKDEPKVPPIEEAARAALRYAGLDADHIRQWRRRIRKAPLLPRLQLGFDRRLRNSVNVNIEDSVAVNSSGVTVGPAQQTQVQDDDTDLSIEIKAVWYLDQLLFSKDDLDISAETRALVGARERLLNQVRRHYFKRMRLARELNLLKDENAGSLREDLKRLDLAEETAALDSLTGGWFGSALGEEP